MRGLYWVRNDHRFHDNQTLSTFCKECSEGLFFWREGETLKRASSLRYSFYAASLQSFSKRLKEKNQSLIVSKKESWDFLEKLLQLHKIEAIYFSSEVGTEEEKDAGIVSRMAQAMNIKVVTHWQDTLLDRDDYEDLSQKTKKIFTEFRKEIEKNLLIRKPLSEPDKIPRSIITPPVEPSLGDVQIKIPEMAGEAAGLKKLETYFWQLDRAKTYKETRNGLLDWNDSTKFSLWLCMGALSPRRIYAELKSYEENMIKNDSTYWIFFELLWRDYFKLFGQRLGRDLFLKKPREQQADDDAFRRWCDGRTGKNFIDAHMTELKLTGWMSNRGRQNVASFLAKELKLPWQWGAKWFEKNLLDYDVTSNWGNWQYFSGVGTDPRDRAFNIETQAKVYDPDEAYRRKWLPERYQS